MIEKIFDATDENLHPVLSLIEEELEKTDMLQLYREVEMPTAYYLYQMEREQFVKQVRLIFLISSTWVHSDFLSVRA